MKYVSIMMYFILSHFSPKNILRFWLDKGVDGFRVDAVRHLFEVEGESSIFCCHIDNIWTVSTTSLPFWLQYLPLMSRIIAKPRISM